MEELKDSREDALSSNMNTLKTNLLEWLNMVELHKAELQELEDYYVRLAVEQQAYWDLFQKLREAKS